MGPKKKKKVCLEKIFSIVSIIQHSILWVWIMKIENKIFYFQIIKYELQWQNGKKIKFVGPFFSFFLSLFSFLSSSDPLHHERPFFIFFRPTQQPMVFFFAGFFLSFSFLLSFFFRPTPPCSPIKHTNTNPQAQTHNHGWGLVFLSR